MPSLSREVMLEILLESLHVPTTVHLPGGIHEQTASSTSADTHLAPRRLTFTSEDLEPTAERSVRVASRLCSFICQLDRHLAWREGRHTALPLEARPRTLTGKRKHSDEEVPSAQLPPYMGSLQRQQIIYLSLMIRNYTNDGEGSPSFSTFDANQACTLTWHYLIKRFSQTELKAILLRTLEQAKVLLQSEFTPAHQRNLLQVNPQTAEENWQGKEYFPAGLRLQDPHQLDLEAYDFRTLKRASLQLRLLQQLRTITASTPTSASEQIREGWEFLEQDRDLSKLDYEEYHSKLVPMIPHYQDTLREILTLYRLWLSTPLSEEDFLWVRNLIVGQRSTRDTLHRYFADSLWQQVRQRYGGDQGDLEQAQGVLTIISPLHDQVFEDYKNFAVALTLLLVRHRQHLKQMLNDKIRG